MAAALVVLLFCSNRSIIGFVIGVVMSIFIIVAVLVAHPCRLLLRRRHHYVT